MGHSYTFALRSSTQSKSNKLKLVDLVREGKDEGAVEGQSLSGALSVVEELYQSIGQLMPQLSLPEVFERDEQVLEVCWSGIPLLCEEVGDRVDVHLGLYVGMKLKNGIY